MFSGIGLGQEIQLRMHQNASQSIRFLFFFWGRTLVTSSAYFCNDRTLNLVHTKGFTKCGNTLEFVGKYTKISGIAH